MVNRRTFLKATGTAGVVGLTGLAGCSALGGGGGGDDSRSLPDTTTFIMSPTEPQDLMMAQYSPFQEHLTSELDTEVELQYGRNYSALLQSLGSFTGHVGETGPFAAALGVNADQADIVLQRKGYGSWAYTSVIATREDSDIESVSDLEGAEVAFADKTSASGSLYPLWMMQDEGLEIGNAPSNDNGADFSASWSGHASAFESLQQGQADAAGVGKFITLNDAREPVEGIQYLADYQADYNSDGIPRAPIVVSPQLSEDAKSSIAEAFKDAPAETYYGADGEEGTDDDIWFSDVRDASVETYQPVIDVANELDISTDLLNQATN